MKRKWQHLDLKSLRPGCSQIINIRSLGYKSLKQFRHDFYRSCIHSLRRQGRVVTYELLDSNNLILRRHPDVSR